MAGWLRGDGSPRGPVTRPDPTHRPRTTKAEPFSFASRDGASKPEATCENDAGDGGETPGGTRGAGDTPGPESVRNEVARRVAHARRRLADPAGAGAETEPEQPAPALRRAWA